MPFFSVAVHSAAVEHSLTLRNVYRSKWLLQVLRELPTNLAVFVLQASAVPLNVQLPALPEDLHGLAVQAAFPDIVARGCLSLDVALVGTAAATAALSAFPGLLQQAQQTANLIQISMRGINGSRSTRLEARSSVEKGIELLKAALCCAFTSEPVAVDLSGIEMPFKVINEILEALAAVSGTTSLDMCVSDRYSKDACVPLWRSLAKLTGLHSLCFYYRTLKTATWTQSATSPASGGL